jgi:hypothetical protein
VVVTAAKGDTERLELSGSNLLSALLASGELSAEILITLASGRKKSVGDAFFQFGQVLFPVNVSQYQKKSISYGL